MFDLIVTRHDRMSVLLVTLYFCISYTLVTLYARMFDLIDTLYACHLLKELYKKRRVKIFSSPSSKAFIHFDTKFYISMSHYSREKLVGCILSANITRVDTH